MEKVISKEKSKDVYVVSFGSDELAEMLTDSEYKQLLVKLRDMRPEDIAALPLAILGSKTVKLRTEKHVLTTRNKLHFVPTKNKRAPADITKDAFFKRAATQLELLLDTGSPKFIVVPYYIEARLRIAS